MNSFMSIDEFRMGGMSTYYRGGPSLAPRLIDVILCAVEHDTSEPEALAKEGASFAHASGSDHVSIFPRLSISSIVRVGS